MARRTRYNRTQKITTGDGRTDVFQHGFGRWDGSAHDHIWWTSGKKGVSGIGAQLRSFRHTGLHADAALRGASAVQAAAGGEPQQLIAHLANLDDALTRLEVNMKVADIHLSLHQEDPLLGVQQRLVAQATPLVSDALSAIATARAATERAEGLAQAASEAAAKVSRATAESVEVAARAAEQAAAEAAAAAAEEAAKQAAAAVEQAAKTADAAAEQTAKVAQAAAEQAATAAKATAETAAKATKIAVEKAVSVAKAVAQRAALVAKAAAEQAARATAAAAQASARAAAATLAAAASIFGH